jgi:hypothetical protein
LSSSADSVPAADLWGDTRMLGPVAGTGRWPARIGRAWRFAVGDFDAVVVALAGFLARGGIVLLAIPSAILPSFLGLASIFSVNALGIDGRPTPWLIATVAWLSVAGAVWLAIAAIVGSIVDVWLIRAAIPSAPAAVARPQRFPDPVLVLDMAGIRVACLLPTGAAIVAAWSPIYNAAYSELTAPTNLSDPLFLRIAWRAAVPIGTIAAAWLAGETVAAVAVRRLFLGEGVWRALAGAIRQLVTRPLSTLLTLLTTMVVSFAGLGAGAGAAGVAFGLCLDAARLPDPVGLIISALGIDTSRDLRPVVFLGAAVVLGFAWALALAVAGITSAWRSAAWTEETASAVDHGIPLTGLRERLADASPDDAAHRHTADL